MAERPEWIDHWPDPRVVRARRWLNRPVPVPRWVRRVLMSLGFLVGLATWIVLCVSVAGIALYVFLENAR